MNSNLYLSRDFYLTAYLLAAGQSLLAHKRSNGLTTFTFEDSASLQSLCDAYYGGRALVDPVKYGNSVRNLKSLLHSSTLSTSHSNSSCPTIQEPQNN